MRSMFACTSHRSGIHRKGNKVQEVGNDTRRAALADNALSGQESWPATSNFNSLNKAGHVGKWLETGSLSATWRLAEERARDRLKNVATAFHFEQSDET